MQPFINPSMYAELDYRRERIAHDLRRTRPSARRHHHIRLPHRRREA